LSFGALVKSIPNIPNGAYHQLPYLALDYTFSYNYSAGILLELQQQNNTSENAFLGIAPTFDHANFQKTNLDKTASEITNIAQLFRKGKTISGEIATKSQFLEIADQYKILHLATHATAYDSLMKEGAIYFADDQLTLQEIYNLPLSAQLAVLSACESGTGTISTGEGVMSLARAFMYQGVPSVVASLWNANDKSTNEIMLQFYQYLKDGKPKAEALKMAKEDYLSTSSIKNAHPFYWSGMIMIGDNSTLTSSNGSFYKWLILGLLIFLAIAFFVRRRFSPKHF
jgi:CHAT domain-containing protein